MRRYNHSVGFQIPLFQCPTHPNHVIYSEKNDVSPCTVSHKIVSKAYIWFSFLTISYIVTDFLTCPYQFIQKK